MTPEGPAPLQPGTVPQGSQAAPPKDEAVDFGTSPWHDFGDRRTESLQDSGGEGLQTSAGEQRRIPQHIRLDPLLGRLAQFHLNRF